jgi:hypothetical protein
MNDDEEVAWLNLAGDDACLPERRGLRYELSSFVLMIVVVSLENVYNQAKKKILA